MTGKIPDDFPHLRWYNEGVTSSLNTLSAAVNPVPRDSYIRREEKTKIY